MTQINNDTLDLPYAAFDVSVFQPFATDTRTVEIIATGLALLTQGQVPPVLYEIGATPGRDGDGDSHLQELRELDRYVPSQVYRNALRKLHAHLLNVGRDSELAKLNPFVRQSRSSRGLAVDLDVMLSAFDALHALSVMLTKTDKDGDAVWATARLELIRRFEEAPPGSPVSLRTATPFGLLHRYRQHFFYSKLRAGPLEQVKALAPWESLEVVMAQSYLRTFEETVENELEVTKSDSAEQKDQYELTDRISASVAQSSTMTVSASGSSNAVLWSASGTATSTMSSSSAQATEQVVRRLHETTRKQSEQIRKRTKVTTRVVETRSESTTTRHVIENKTGTPANYGLRRLGYDVDCKIQDLGPLLVWQSFIKRPGELLARSDLLDKKWHTSISEIKEITVDFEVQTGGNRPGWRSLSVPVGPKLLEIFRSEYKDQTQEDREFFQKAKVVKSAAYITEDFGSKDRPNLIDTTSKYPGMTVEYDSVKKIFNVDLGEPSPRWFNFRILASVTSDKRVQLPTDPLLPDDEKSEIMMARLRLQAVMDFSSKRKRDSLEFEERKVLLGKALGQLIDPTYAGDLLGDRLSAFYLEVNDIFDLPRMFYDIDVAEWREAKKVVAGESRSSRTYSLHSKQDQPAPSGSSLEWEHQIDGDTRRDMFLNAEFAWIGIPVKPAKEREAEAFLRRCGHLMVDDVGITELLKRLERLRAAEALVARMGFDAEKVAVKPSDFPNPDPRAFLYEEDELKELGWNDVYPIISQQHTVTTVDGFLFDVLEVGGERKDGDGASRPEGK